VRNWDSRFKISERRPMATWPGDWVLIHAGFALSKINEEDAEEQMRMLMLLGEDKAALEPVRGYGLDQKNPEDAPQNS
jgi:HupF/HypC family